MVGHFQLNLHVVAEAPDRHVTPDPGDPGFAEECRRQSLLVGNDPREEDIMDWLDAVRDTDGWV